jgi:DNA/RNA endonuclease G (NUC1)
MRSKLLGPVIALLVGVGIISCSDLITNTTSPMKAARGAAFDATPTPKVRITQVYGAGGNSGALFNQDFVEIYNEGTAAQDLTNWSIQYASAAGTGNLGSSSSQLVLLSGSIAPGQFYLIGMTPVGGNGAALPAADKTGTIAMAAGAGKVALANQATTVGCNTAATCAGNAAIVDVVAYGSTNWSGATAVGAPTIDASHSDVRKDVCIDTDNDANDFQAITPPNPRNSSVTTAVCAGGTGPVIGPLDHVVVTGTATVAATATTTLTARLQDASNQTISDPSATYTWASSDESKAKVTATSLNTATITGVAAGQTNITATATSGGVTKTSANFVVTVTGGTGPNLGPVTSNTIFVSEIHYDNAGTDANEALEIETPAGANLAGYTLALYDGAAGLTYPSGIAPMRIDSLTPTICPSGTRQVIVFNFPVNGLQNGSQDGASPTIPDGWAIIGPDAKPVELMSYEGTFVAANGPAVNYLSTDIGKAESAAASATQSLQRAGNGVWFGPSSNTMGACNPAEPVAPQTIIIQDRPTPLPVGFQDQFFIGSGSHDGSGAAVGNGDVKWSSSAPDIVSVVDTTGILTALKAGQVTITATAKSDGATGTAIVTAAVLPTSPTARVGHNTDLGIPADADASDDIIISRRQYTLSYNPNHGDPNWVSWNLDASHKGTAARCDCFSADPEVAKQKDAQGNPLPAYNTSDWINGGVWSRGHMSPSADWNVSDGDNAPTFYLSNMLPQNQTLNAGPWGDLENHLRDLAVGSTEIYIIAGGIFTKGRTGGVDGFGFMHSTGHILVPDSVWKIAIVVPDTRAVNGITSPSDVQVIATKFPNEAVSGSYTGYLSTIDAIQKSTGYDFLSTLPENIQCRLESRNCLPAAAITGPTSGDEGQTLAFDGTSSSDPDGGQLSYQWTVNGQVAGIQPTLSYAFPQNGEYDVTLVVSDIQGGSSTKTTTVSIANVAPTVAAFPGGNVDAGGTYTSSGSFTDPAADTWTGTVNYGDGTGAQTLAISGKTFTLSHKYAAVGTFNVTVSISDGLGLGSNVAMVTSVNHPPVARIAGAGLNGGPEGTLLTFDASTSSDPDAGDVLSYQWSVNGSVVGIGATLSHAFPDNGSYAVSVVVSDLFGGTSTTSANVTITNANPTAVFNAPSTVGETSPIVLSVSNVSDPSSVDVNAGLQIAFDCGAGAGYTAPGSATSVRCPTTEDGVRSVHARITDKDGGVTVLTASVAILNVAPTVTFKAVTPTTIQSGDIVATTGSFTDPGMDAPWTSSIAWGDGQTTPTLPSRLVVSGEKLIGGTQYKKVGTFTATLTVTDNDGGAGSSSLIYTVSRRNIGGSVDPRVIRLSNGGGDDVTITLVRDLLANMADLDVSSVKIGTVGVNKKNNGRFDYRINGNGTSAELTFSKKALIAAGVLTSSTEELTLTGQLTNGIQIVSNVAVTTR